MNIPGIYYQRDPRWSGTHLGSSNDTIGMEGCLITAVANLNWYTGHNMTPLDVNGWLLGNGGYQDGELVVWGRLPVLNPDLISHGTTTDINTLNTFLAAEGNFAIVQLRKAGFPMHFSVAPFPSKIADSWDGQLKPLSSYTFVMAHLYVDATPDFITPQPAVAPKIVAPTQPVVGQVTVTVPVLNVHRDFGDSGNFANTTGQYPGKLTKGVAFSYTGVMEGPDPYNDGRKYWLITVRGNKVWAGGTSFVQPAAPAPAPSPEPVPAPPANTGAPVIESASPGPVEPTVVPVEEPPAVDSVSTAAKETRIIPPAKVVTTEVIFVYDLQTEKAVAKIPKGKRLDLVGITTIRGKNFFRASVEGHEWSSNHVVAPYYLEQLGGTSVKLDHITNPVWKSILRFLHVIH